MLGTVFFFMVLHDETLLRRTRTKCSRARDTDTSFSDIEGLPGNPVLPAQLVHREIGQPAARKIPTSSPIHPVLRGSLRPYSYSIFGCRRF